MTEDEKLSTVMLRSEIDEMYKWKLEDIFASDSEWEACFKSTLERAKSFSEFRGNITSCADNLLRSLEYLVELGNDVLSISAYACMRRDEDNNVSKYRAMADRVNDAESECASNTSFFEPEVISAGREKIFGYIDEDVRLSKYRHYFEDVFRRAEHTLDEKCEELLAMSGPMSESSGDAFSSLNNADLKFDDIKDENGKITELTHGRYGTFMESKDRKVRKSAYESMYAQYIKYKNTFASMYAGNVKSDRFFARVRGYSSSLEMHLADGNISADIYDRLISDVRNGIPVLNEYLNLKKKMLGISELKMYDLYAPTVPHDSEKITYEKACEIVLDAVAPLGKQYTDDMKKAFSERWVDVCENKGKTPGAYSWGDNRTHPFVLLNYQGEIEDVFTLAHEMGHAMHSYYTNSTQPDIYRNYKIFVAEVASTVNENLLMDYLLRNAEGDRLAYLLGRELESIRTTFYRQTMFAEFEKAAHGAYAEGEALTADYLCSLYGGINSQYYSASVDCDENISFEWARIPHFYTSFYVYQYATGFSAASRLKELVSENSENAKKYIEFLKCGDSKYPIDALKCAGADLTKSETAESVVRRMKKSLDRLSEISNGAY